MKSARSLTQNVVFRAAFFCCPAALLVLSGCGGSTGDSGGTVTSTSDCSTTTADALVSVDSADDNSLLASAITSGCDEVAVYEDNGSVSQAAVLLDNGTQVAAEFNDEGQVVAVRSDDDVLAISYNDALGFARAEFTSDTGDSSASVFSVSRDDGTSARRFATQANGNGFAFCDELEQFARILASACEANSSQPFCGGNIDRAAQAAVQLCGENVEQVERLEDTVFDDNERDFALGVDGFVTARAAANDGTTFICAAEAFGGQPPYDVEWTVTSTPAGASAPITQLPGGAAVADGTTNVGVYELKVTVTDAEGMQAFDDITFDLGSDQFFGVNIIASNDNPEIAEVVKFKAVTNADSTAEIAQSDSIDDQSAPGTIYWDFGDGASATGNEVEHSYSEPGVYEVFVMVIAQAECDYSDLITIVVGDGGGDTHEGEFRVEIVASADSMKVGDVVTLNPVTTGALEPVDYGWGIVNPEAESFAILSEGVSVVNAQSVFTETAILEAFAEGIVQVGILAVDAAGRVAIDTKPIPVFGPDGGLFVVIEGPFFLETGQSGVLNAFAVGGDGTLSYNWFVENDPFGDADDNTMLSLPHSESTEIMGNVPGFVGVGLVVSDQSGHVAEAFTGLEIFAAGFDDLFVEFLGPYQVPANELAPLHSFISGGEAPYFCSWHVFNPAGAVILDPFSCFDTAIEFSGPGCVDIELEVEDIAGAIGFKTFEVCAGDAFAFDCPYDDVCDPNCTGFDPDCEDPCPLDGFCDEFCGIGDPDCFEGEFCVAGDDFCDDFCADFGAADPDCDHCGQDGVCVFFCPNFEDPDCAREFCVSGDGLCDFGCYPEDTDCAETYCQPEDGFCDFPCNVPDPDCGSNQQMCDEFYFCCDGDGFCDENECPEFDADCNGCASDGVCVQACFTPDPDCEGGVYGCVDDYECDDFDQCTFDYCDFGTCISEFDFNCTVVGGDCLDSSSCDDSDSCTFDYCDVDGLCKHDTDPNCLASQNCGDGFCEATLGEDEFTCTADCQAAGFCGDGICESTLGEDEFTCLSDCPTTATCGDGTCDSASQEDCTACPSDCGPC